MSLTDSDDDVEPGSSADSLLRRMGHRPHGETTLSRKGPVDPDSLEAQLVGAGVVSPFNTWQFEEALRQEASSAVDRRQHEIQAFEQALHGALAELQRVRAAEEARLAARVQEATRRFQQQMEALQQQYVAEVEKLKRQTVSELHRQRANSEAAIAARVRALQGELRFERPTGLSPGLGPLAAASVAVPRGATTQAQGQAEGHGPGRGQAAVAAAWWRTRDSSPGGMVGLAGGGGRHGASIRMRSGPATRALSSPAPAATPKATVNWAEGVW